MFTGLDVNDTRSTEAKAMALRTADLKLVNQEAQLTNPSFRVSLDVVASGPLLARLASSYQGIKTGDDSKFRRCFWEIVQIDPRWRFHRVQFEKHSFTVDWNTLLIGQMTERSTLVYKVCQHGSGQV